MRMRESEQKFNMVHWWISYTWFKYMVIYAVTLIFLIWQIPAHVLAPCTYEKHVYFPLSDLVYGYGFCFTVVGNV
jgi:hypothetical protein